MAMLKGSCVTCNKKCSSRVAGAHLIECMQQSNNIGKGASQGYLVKASSRTDLAKYWMFLLVPKKVSLDLLDIVLRREWLECCGHLSAFTIGGVEYSSDTEEARRGLNVSAAKVFQPGLQCIYEYDFGSTSELLLEVVSLVSGISTDTIHVLMQNDDPELTCQLCQTLATLICSFCREVFCTDECAAKHDCVQKEGDTYMMSDLKNSPRTGVCGY